MSQPSHHVTLPHDIDAFDVLAALREDPDNLAAVLVEFLGGLDQETYATVAEKLMGFIQMNPAQ